MIRSKRLLSLACLIWLFAGAKVAEAGMPMMTLSDMARMRIQNISFFLLALLISALVFRWLWNSLGKELLNLPKLSFRKALTLTVLWGLLFAFVLTMIAGARELLTPQAWKKDGLLYKITDKQEKSLPDGASAKIVARQMADRTSGLSRLSTVLSSYAVAHDGNYPQQDARDIPDSFWHMPGQDGYHYIFKQGRKTTDGRVPLAFEPELFEGRMVLFADGHIELLDAEEFNKLLDQE
jgi:prepilin-type processing-associated H-X9-DG protein